MTGTDHPTAPPRGGIARREVVLRLGDCLGVIALLALIRELHYWQFPGFWSLVVAVVVVQQVAFHAAGAYHVLRLGTLRQWLGQAMVGWLAVLGLLFAGLYALKVGAEVPRLVAGPWALASAVWLLLVRVLVWRDLLRRYRRGVAGERVLVVGDHAYGRRLARHLATQPSFALRVVGIATDARRGDGAGDRFPVLGAVDDVPRLIAAHGIERVIITGPITDQQTIFRTFDHLARQPVTVQYAPDLSRFSLIGFRAQDYAGQPVFNLSASPIDGSAVLGKWLEDKLLALLALLLASPIMLLTAVIIKATSPGPVLFVQQRHGLHGHPIRVYKFRSMVVPQERTAAEQASAGVEGGTDGFRQATAGDPRITWIGRIIRATSIDELPQIINVLKGDMSLVGPRPHPIGLNLQYAEVIDELMKRHYVKPGITGLAQISGARGETRTAADMQKRIHYDLEYINNWSLWLDLKILCLTVIKGIVTRQP